MAVEETKEQQQIYNLFRNCIYLILIIELIVNLPIGANDRFFGVFYHMLSSLKIFNNVALCKFFELICVGITCIGTRAKKDLKFNFKTMVAIPAISGAVLIFLCLIFYPGHWGGMFMPGITINRLLYAFCSVLGIMFIHQGLDAISRYYHIKLDEDRFNFENESFQQSEELVNNKYSVNIPMIYYFKKKMHKGWINIVNPFRATIVLGTPGSGKSFGVIDPFIRQHSAKGFAMMVYDYKFPTLTKNLFYQYCKNKKQGTLPENCTFNIINFSDIEYSNHINPIQAKYIDSLAAASETAATLLESLNKGGGDKKGGSDDFFTHSAENFLASIIYFFVNLHPTGFYKGKKLNRFVACNGHKYKLIIKGWNQYVGLDHNGYEVLDFTEKKQKSSGDIETRNVSVDMDGLFVNPEGLTYLDMDEKIHIDKCWYEDENGNEVTPDTISGEYSDMPHVLSFLSQSYTCIFDLLMQDKNIAPLMAPFQSAWQNGAMDQLEGMVGTLRVNAARLVSPESYWVFTGDDFDLKISDPKHPCYLVIANDPEKEQVIGALNALILNRLITRVNSKGNIPVSLIIDELPTLYVHKIDRLIGTARSNKVSVTVGFQELPQLEADYGKVGMQKILSTCGNIFMGAARNKETLEWAQNDLFGKVKQVSKSISITDQKVSTSLSEKQDNLLPAAKIADMATGWLAGQAARDFTPTDEKVFNGIKIEQSEEFKTTKYFCKTHFDMDKIADEEQHYVQVPKIYTFRSETDKKILLSRNFNKVNSDVAMIIDELLSPEGRAELEKMKKNGKK